MRTGLFERVYTKGRSAGFGTTLVSFGVPLVRVARGVLKQIKSIWWMPWHREAMKDVALCDKLRGGESTL